MKSWSSSSRCKSYVRSGASFSWFRLTPTAELPSPANTARGKSFFLVHNLCWCWFSEVNPDVGIPESRDLKSSSGMTSISWLPRSLGEFANTADHVTNPVEVVYVLLTRYCLVLHHVLITLAHFHFLCTSAWTNFVCLRDKQRQTSSR